MAPSMTLILSALFLILDASALIPDPVGLVYAPASIGKRQTFTGTLGGSAPAVTDTGDPERPYGVDGDTFKSVNSYSDSQHGPVIILLPPRLSGSVNCMSTVSSTSVASQDATIASAPTATSSTTDATTVTAQLAQTTIPYDSEFDLVCDL
ncbi:hypothetical protein BDV37DRAFT_289027 [Aspergillus pseudonomiae]|uniref:Uncharacterized protein n=1 Tax=Aspergillus pseudonomiae TaxID=1506151 RepID=A0A5N7CWG3_9EURO|nr:uncharacterized protein BDV37DRAFT_289027 [Aspergillus pseudonomiae]KAE8397908.1 hypothetical protein BDV37DRAFT_289027 [Aspergillus pseudonomiae]